MESTLQGTVGQSPFLPSRRHSPSVETVTMRLVIRMNESATNPKLSRGAWHRSICVEKSVQLTCGENEAP